MNIKNGVIDSSVIVALFTPEKYSEWVDKTLNDVEEWISIDGDFPFIIYFLFYLHLYSHKL